MGWPKALLLRFLIRTTRRISSDLKVDLADACRPHGRMHRRFVQNQWDGLVPGLGAVNAMSLSTVSKSRERAEKINFESVFLLHAHVDHAFDDTRIRAPRIPG